MLSNVPPRPKIYHILPVKALPLIVDSQCLWSNAKVSQELSDKCEPSIGMQKIKQRRLNELKLVSYPDLYVGECVPFYFCPRSVMLYLIYKKNQELSYKDGQELIIHLEADLHETISWAKTNNKRWVFTLSNAGAYYFEDRKNLEQLSDINWDAVNSIHWATIPRYKEEKQAEFLLEEQFPWSLVTQIGVFSNAVEEQVNSILLNQNNKPTVSVKNEWYY